MYKVSILRAQKRAEPVGRLPPHFAAQKLPGGHGEQKSAACQVWSAAAGRNQLLHQRFQVQLWVSVLPWLVLAVEGLLATEGGVQGPGLYWRLE